MTEIVSLEHLVDVSENNKFDSEENLENQKFISAEENLEYEKFVLEENLKNEEMLTKAGSPIIVNEIANVTCRARMQNKRKNRKKKRKMKKFVEDQNNSSPAKLFELIVLRNEKLKPILRAAKQSVARSVRRSISTNSRPRIRFLESPKYIDITPRPEKVPGIVKMSDSPRNSIKISAVSVVPNEEEAKFFENLPFTEETTKPRLPSTRRRRSSTRRQSIPITDLNSDDPDICILPVQNEKICMLSVQNEDQQASTSSRPNRRRSFLVAAERMNGQLTQNSLKKTPKKEILKRKFDENEKKSIENEMKRAEEIEKHLFPLFIKKSKRKKSPKKIVGMKKIIIDEKFKKKIELIVVDDDVSDDLKHREAAIVDSWDSINRPICSEKDFAPFEGLCHIAGDSNDFKNEPANHFHPFIDDQYENCSISYPGSSFSSFFSSLESEHQANNRSISNGPDELSALYINEQSNLPWVEKYRPKSSQEFVGDSQVVLRLKEWLNKWKIRLLSKAPSTHFNVRSPQKSKKRKTSESNEEFIDDDDECNTAIIKGPTGVGKSCLVYLLAEELGFNVIEINASARRSSKDVLADHLGATHSHRIDRRASKPVLVASPPKVHQKKDLRSFFVKQNSSPADLSPSNKQPEHQPIQSSTNSNAASIILFDDVDVIFEEDENFWNGIRCLTDDCRVPVILTSSEMDVPGLKSLNVAVEEFILTKITKHACADRLSTIFASTKSPPIDNFVEKSTNLVSIFNCDLRKLTNHLQFWSNLNGTCESDDDDDVVTFRNGARLLDGLNDKISLDDDSRTKCISSNAVDHAANRQLNCLRINLPPRSAACELDLAVDYLPYLRRCASISRDRCETKRRFRHYFHKIGLDDKWGSVQNVLQEKIF